MQESSNITRKTGVICIGVIWLVSPVAIALDLLHANVAVGKLIAWGTYNVCKKHKTHPEGRIIHHPLSSSGHVIYIIYYMKWKLRLSLQGPFGE